MWHGGCHDMDAEAVHNDATDDGDDDDDDDDGDDDDDYGDDNHNNTGHDADDAIKVHGAFL